MKNDLQYTTAKPSIILKPSIYRVYAIQSESVLFFLYIVCTNDIVHAIFALDIIIFFNVIICNYFMLLSAITTIIYEHTISRMIVGRQEHDNAVT